MALTFPRAMPDYFAAAQYFEPRRNDFMSPENSGRLGGVQAGFPVWEARWSWGQTISRDLSDQMRGLVASLRGPQRTFYGRDHARPLPKAYPLGFGGMARAGGGAFDGTATSWSVNGTRDVVTLNGLPASFRFGIGDYIMFRWTTSGQQRRGLARSLEVVTGTSGGVLAVTVEPALSTVIPAGAVADLLNPGCIMKAVPGETKIGEMGRTQKASGQLVGLQELLP